MGRLGKRDFCNQGEVPWLRGRRVGSPEGMPVADIQGIEFRRQPSRCCCCFFFFRNQESWIAQWKGGRGGRDEVQECWVTVLFSFFFLNML